MSQHPQGTEGVFCRRCGYNLSGTAVGAACPECGEPVSSSFGQGPGSVRPSSGKAITSMILGIVGIVGCVLYGIPSLICGIIAIFFWYFAKRDIATGAYSENSQGFATAGLVCGIIATVIGVVILALLVAGFVFAFTQAPPSHPTPPSPTFPNP